MNDRRTTPGGLRRLLLSLPALIVVLALAAYALAGFYLAPCLVSREIPRFADERLQRIFTFQSMYAGLAPYEALAIYAVITYMDSVNGVYVPDGDARPAGRPGCGREGSVFRYGTRVDPARPGHAGRSRRAWPTARR
jgi:hypothetical protein